MLPVTADKAPYLDHRLCSEMSTQMCSTSLAEIKGTMHFLTTALFSYPPILYREWIQSRPFLVEEKYQKTQYYNIKWELEFIHTCMCFCQNSIVTSNVAGTVLGTGSDEGEIAPLYPPEAPHSVQHHLGCITELCLRRLRPFISRRWENCHLLFCLLGYLVLRFSGIYSLAVLLEQKGGGEATMWSMASVRARVACLQVH